MAWLTYLLTGGFLKGYRTFILGGVLVLDAVAKYLVGDMSFVVLMTNLPELLTGLGLFAAAAHKQA